MKKLMIAMGAATMAALCAQADVPEGYTSGIDFEDTELGPLNVTLDDTNASTEGAKLWSSDARKTDGTVDSTVVEGNYLKIDETAVLTRSAGILVEADEENGIPENTIPEGGDITIATKVQFTAADDKPTVSEGDKILVWAKAPADGDEDKNIYICITDGTATEENPYIVTKKAVQVDTWYDLKIVAKVGGTDLEPVTVFDVIVGEDTIATGCKSMVTTGDAATTISSIGFKGTGAVDDIGFKATAGVPTYPLVVEAENITTVTYKVNGEGDAITYAEGASFPQTATTLVFTVTPADGYVVKSALTVDAEGEEVTLTVVDNTLTVTVADYLTEDGLTIAFDAKQSGGDWPAAWEVPSGATAEQLAAFKEWAKTNEATATNAKEAFLMGVDVADYEELAVTSISIVDGKAVIETNADSPNGVVYVKYGETVDCDDGFVAGTDELPADTAAKFYKVCIDFVMPTAE